MAKPDKQLALYTHKALKELKVKGSKKKDSRSRGRKKKNTSQEILFDEWQYRERHSQKDTTDQTSKRKGGQASIADVLSRYSLPTKKQLTHEFQQFAYKLACEMGEEDKKALYFRLAKREPRGLLERARSYVIDAPNVTNKGRLFMWALGKLKRGETLKYEEKE